MPKKRRTPRKRLRRTAPAVASSTGVFWITLIYFCSGVCSLIDEVLWVRLLKLTLGNTVYASSIVVSTFMGGLAIGSFIMARYADRVKRPLRLYAILEVVAALSALLLPWALQLADVVYGWFFVKLQASPTGLLVVQVVVSAGLLLVPTMVMGSTLPLLGRYVTPLRDRAGRLVGGLYALNMLGATLGCFLGGFVLIRALGVMGALYVAAGVNLLVAFAGWVLSRSHDVAAEAPAELPSEGPVPLPAEQAVLRKKGVLVVAFFLSGLVSIGYELVWMRSIAFWLGGFTYVFSAVLTIYLLGNVIGAWIGSRLCKRLKRPAVGFGVSLSCLGVLGVVYMPSFTGWFLKGATPVFSSFGGLLTTSGIHKAAAPLVHGFVLFLIPAVAMGIGFPLALQAWANYRHKVGQSTGTVYGANTMGAVLGGLVTGFLLIPWLGVQLSITVLGLAAVWGGWVMVQAFSEKLTVLPRVGHTLLSVALSAAAVAIPSDLFERNIVSRRPGETLAVEEAVTTTLAVIRSPDGHLLLTVDDIPMAGDDIHRCAQKTLGHLGVLLNKDAKQALTIGFGGGETTACLAQHDLDRIDCVEIAPEVVRIALRHFSHINLGDRLEEEVNLIYMDAKNYLRLTDRRYDLIINDSNRHATSGSAPLFTKEHFQSARDHLNPGGLFITKLHLHRHPKSNFDCILATFLDVFPHATIWFPTTKPYIFYYLVGSREEQLFSLKHIEDELREESVGNSVDYLNFHSSSDVLSCYLGDERDIRRYLEEFQINSDYDPYLEFNLDPKHLVLQESFTEFIETVRRDSVVDHIDWSGLSSSEQDRWLTERRLLYGASTHVLRAYGAKSHPLKLLYVSDGLRLIPDHPTLLEQQSRYLSTVKRTLEEGGTGPDRIIAVMDRLLRERPNIGIAHLVKSWALRRKNDWKAARIAGQEAAENAPDLVAAQLNMGTIFLKFGQLRQAAERFQKAVDLDPNSADAHKGLANALSYQAQVSRAIPHFERAIALNPADTEAANNLAWCLATSPLGDDRDGARAVELAERACKATGYKSPTAMDTLAAAYGEAGRFPEAITAATKALQLVGAEQDALAEQIRNRLDLFRAGKPYRERR